MSGFHRVCYSVLSTTDVGTLSTGPVALNLGYKLKTPGGGGVGLKKYLGLSPEQRNQGF